MFDEPTIESLSKQVKELTSKFSNLEGEIKRINESPYLDRNMDNQSKDILGQEVSKKILDIVWDDYYHYHTFFESVGAAGNFGWILSDSGSNSGVDGSGLFLETGVLAGDETFVVKYPTYQNILSFDLESRFRTAFFVDDAGGAGVIGSTPANIRVYIGGGNGVSTSSPYSFIGGDGLHSYGFLLEDSTLYAVTSNGTTFTKAVVMTGIKNNYLYLLEARYSPGKKATFYASDGTAFPDVPAISTRAKERVSISTTLPSGDGTLTRFQVLTTTTVEKNLGVGFYEYIQQKIRP
jgi:hypothetical protein